MGAGIKRLWASETARVTIVAALVAVYAVGSAYLNLAWHTQVVYTHFAYVPVVLAGLWWGRRGMAVAGLLGAVLLGFHAVGIAASPLWHDLARAGFLAAAGGCAGLLSEEAEAGRRAARLSEEQHRRIVEKSLSGIVVYRPSDFRVTFANRRFGEMLGCPADQLVGRSIWEFIAPDEHARVRALVAEREAGGTSDLHYEARLVRADGSALWADVLSSRAPHAGEDAVLVNAYDITARKEAEGKRRELSDIARRQEDQLVHSTRLAELGEMAAAVAHDLNQPLTGIRNFAKNALFMLEEQAAGSEEVKENLRLITEQVDRAARIINQLRGMTRKTERQLAPLDLNAIIRESVEFLTP